MWPYTHVLEYSGGVCIVEMTSHAEADEFAQPMRIFDGKERFALLLWNLPPGMSCTKAVKAGLDGLEFIQAGGTSKAITVDIRKPGGSQWGADWVRYVVGHPHAEPEPLDVPITLPRGGEMVSRSEVFTPDGAAELFFSYYKTGDIPAEYALRPVEGFTKDGRNISISSISHDPGSR